MYNFFYEVGSVVVGPKQSEKSAIHLNNNNSPISKRARTDAGSQTPVDSSENVGGEGIAFSGSVTVG